MSQMPLAFEEVSYSVASPGIFAFLRWEGIHKLQIGCVNPERIREFVPAINGIALHFT